ncbi:hypothetical protein BDA96_09G207700 [Sorghum bicolor]|uniref:Uncharacterized protein n=1 Tax=Sorghum bicolor TaxID=4558 RepID=A0A921QD04_SORBI|nr:hypothetical protein BDA96_09G207700 [Sorghum bicolor]
MAMKCSIYSSLAVTSFNDSMLTYPPLSVPVKSKIFLDNAIMLSCAVCYAHVYHSGKSSCFSLRTLAVRAT